jgi:hypothetical protein
LAEAGTLARAAIVKASARVILVIMGRYSLLSSFVRLQVADTTRSRAVNVGRPHT